MAVITPNTFMPLRRYVGVRLQQGVPIVDADWNELEDVRRFELRAFLKWFVGDGVPDGPNQDAFRIEGTGAVDDFTIRAGLAAGAVDGLRNVGRCLVDGLDVMIEANVTYRGQDLHDSRPGAAALRARRNVTRSVQEMSDAAFVDGPLTGPDVTVYLDVWEWMVTPSVDPALVHPGLGTESCVRMRREWVVRVRNGLSAPQPGGPGSDPGHSYYALATLRWQPGQTIDPSDVTDRRDRRLLLPPATLVEDIFGGTAAEYRRGRNRPPVSMRHAINALLRGEVPATDEAAIMPAPGSTDMVSRGTVFDGAGRLVTVWTSDRMGGVSQVFGAPLNLANPGAGFVGAPRQITAGVAHSRPHAITLDNGELLVVYESATTGVNEDVHFKRGTFGALGPGLAEAPVTATATRERAPFAVRSGAAVAIIWHQMPGSTWNFNWLDLATNTFPAASQPLSAVTGPFPVPNTPPTLHAVRDAAGDVWTAFASTADNIRTQVVPAGGGAPVGGTDHDSGGTDRTPFLLVDTNDDVWLFWSASAAGVMNIRARRFVRATSTWDAIATVPGTDSVQAVGPVAVLDEDRAIWLFWQGQQTAAANFDIWYTRHSPTTGAWSEPRSLTAAPNADLAPFVVADTSAASAAPGVLWLFWQRQIAGAGELFFRRLITRL
jgi:hypothetical protein